MAHLALNADESDSNTSEAVDYRNEDDWADIERDVEMPTFVSLFDDRTFTDLNELLRYCHATYDFDFWNVRKTFGVPAHVPPTDSFRQFFIQLTPNLG